MLGGEDVPAFKPDPRGLLLALERLAVAPADAIYVGDTTIDAEAAANAGLRFVAVLTGPTTRADFAPYRPSPSSTASQTYPPSSASNLTTPLE